MSRLTCPPQIQLESRRTGAVLTRRMGTYKEVVLIRVATNHTILLLFGWICGGQVSLDNNFVSVLLVKTAPVLLLCSSIFGGHVILDDHSDLLYHQIV